MPRVEFKQQSHQVTAGNTILDALLEAGEAIPHSCKSGVCQSCLMRAVCGEPPAASQLGLRESQVERGFFLPCVAHPKSDLTVELPDTETESIPARIDQTLLLSETVVLVKIELLKPFEYRAGQFVNLIRADGLVRSYSVANLPNSDQRIEFHVRKVTNGQMSQWLFDQENEGEPVRIAGPAGDCFYLPSYAQQDLLLAGTGTGLAPLLGIVRDALQNNHQGEIYLYHGARNNAGLYLTDELSSLAERHPRFHYQTVALQADNQTGVIEGELDKVVLERHSQLQSWRVFLCGAPELVIPMRKKVFLAGANSKQIHADAFITRSGTGAQP